MTLLEILVDFKTHGTRHAKERTTVTRTITMAGKTAKKASSPSYLEQIKACILALKERAGSSLPAIKKFLNATPSQYRFINAALKAGVASGYFVKNKGKYKLSAEAKKGPKKLSATPRKRLKSHDNDPEEAETEALQGSVNQLNATSGILGDLSLADVLPSPEAITAAIETVHRYLKAETARAKSEAERYPQTVRVEFEFMALAELEKEIEKMNLEELRKDKYNCELLLHCMHAMRNEIEDNNILDTYLLFLHLITRHDMITAKEKQLEKENEQKKKRKREEEKERRKRRRRK